jgi:hypothetical protein
MMPMQTPMITMQGPTMPMQTPMITMQGPTMQMQAPNNIPSQQHGTVIPPSGHVSQLIQKFDPNSPTKKVQNQNEQKQDSNNPFDLF